MKTAFLSLAFVCAASVSSQALVITINQDDAVRLDFTVTEFASGPSQVDVTGPNSLISATRTAVPNVQIGVNATFTLGLSEALIVDGPTYDLGDFQFDLDGYDGASLTVVPGGFRFVYGTPLPGPGLPDAGSSLVLLGLVMGGLGWTRRLR